jgi:peptidoglycan hydrolase-like protein with peptidoglycan-binding domain
MQSLLAAQGFYHGPISGILDGATRSAILNYQQAARIPATGQPDAATAGSIGVSAPAAAAQNFPPFALSTANQTGVFIQP